MLDESSMNSNRPTRQQAIITRLRIIVHTNNKVDNKFGEKLQSDDGKSHYFGCLPINRFFISAADNIEVQKSDLERLNSEQLGEAL
jgi:hypothetical protein